MRKEGEKNGRSITAIVLWTMASAALCVYCAGSVKESPGGSAGDSGAAGFGFGGGGLGGGGLGGIYSDTYCPGGYNVCPCSGPCCIGGCVYPGGAEAGAGGEAGFGGTSPELSAGASGEAGVSGAH